MGWNNPNFDKELVAKIKRQILPRMEVAGKVVEAYCKDECPVDTGALRDSINSKKHGDDTVVIGTNKEYAGYVEFGTHNMQPRPFLRNGMEKSKADLDSIFKKKLDE